VPVSVSEIGSRSDEFERTPPHDVAAEQCVLGGMLLSKDAISDVIETIRPQDHYRPAHQIIHEAILDMYGRGEPVDAITVADELTKRGDITRVGDRPYLHTLIATVPTAANAGFYARIVRERAILRRLVEAGTRIVQFGYAGDADADELVDRAQAEVYAVTDRRTTEDYHSLSEIMPGALDEIEAIGSRGGVLTGVPTGFSDLDALTNGLHPGQMIVIAARPAVGKALALHTPLPTPMGWTTMGEVAVGDYLIGADGKPTQVVAATEAMQGRPCYEVEFDDGTVIIADAEHQWRTTTGTEFRDVMHTAGRTAGLSAMVQLVDRPLTAVHQDVATTAEIAATLRQPADGRLNHAVAVTAPLDLPHADLPFPPYALGMRLAEGASRIEAGGVLGCKHIPESYLRASQDQRWALLAGLLDNDGTVSPNGSVQLTVTSLRLASDARELVLSLGYRCGWAEKSVNGSDALSTAYTISFTTADDVLRPERKLASQRFITAVRPIESVPVRCVQVDSADRMFLASRSMIPTHNSTLALDFARAAAIKHGMATVVFSLEMGRNEITMRLLSAEARVPMHTMRTGQMNDDDWARLARRMSEVADAPLFIDDSPNMSLMEIRAKCRRLKQRHNLKFVIIDYLQLMSSPKRVESRQQEVSEMSRSLKLLAKELEVPLIALSQLNRGPEQRTDKKPLLSDLRESGCLTGETRILRADTGAEITLNELMASGARDIPVWSLDECLRLVPRTMTHAFPSGIKETFRVRMTSGRQVEATANHPFLTYDGWRAIGDIAAGTRVAVPRHTPAPMVITKMAEDEIVMLGHLIGDGSFVKRQPIRYASIDEANLAAVTEAAKHFGITAIRDEYEAARVTTLRLPAPYRLARGRRNPIAVWLEGLGLFGLRSHEKFVPAPVFSLGQRDLALFLRHLWATDGCVWWDETAGQARIYYASTSRRLVDDVARLLMRFNVMTRIKETRKGEHRPCYQLWIYGAENQLRFLEDIGVHGARGVMAEKARQVLASVKGNTNLDTIPVQVWDRVRMVMAEQHTSQRQFAAAMGTQFCGSTQWKHAPSRERLARVAAVLDDAELEMVATNDVFWDEIASVESIGEQPVYDATVLGTHNFVANGTNLHNSIEQDADVVILLHREDAYEKESPRAGEADLIVAKHRNGPTATVTVAFQGHYSRFVDMAPA
jgi:replicative DNA helicase